MSQHSKSKPGNFTVVQIGTNQGINIIKPYGFDMYAEDYPKNSLLELKTGIKDNRLLGKCIIFNPNSLEEINYKTGYH